MKSALVKKVLELATASEFVCKGKDHAARRAFIVAYLRSNGRVAEMRAKAKEEELHEVDLIVERFAAGKSLSK